MTRTQATVTAALALLLAAHAPGASAQTSPSEAATVLASAAVQASPPRITLNWQAFAGATGHTIHRKAPAATSWGSAVATLGGTATTWQDNSVAVNTAYEYRITRTAPGGTGYGYLQSGIELQPVEHQGTIILLVDGGIAGAIADALAQLQADLKADGWVVVRTDVPPGTTVPATRALVAAHYNADPANTKALFIIGHVPVPYSGKIAPDGHTDQHLGAWPCDGYYADVNGTWTDNTVNHVSDWTWVSNVPGDGKFDQDSPPSAVELQVGRVDMWEMTTFPQTQAQLLAGYLGRVHEFRTKAFTPTLRGIMRDHLEDVVTPLAFGGWASMAPVVGPANITEVPYASPTWLQDQINGQSHLFTYGSGGGLIENDNGTLLFNYMDKVATTGGLASTAWGGVFNMTYCSYIGDWNNRNNVMRAQLASGRALTTCYSGAPNFFFFPMGMGRTTGHGTQLTMNNTTTYLPQSGSDVNPAPRAALALMGDPALRMLYVAMPGGLVVGNSGGNATFSWTAAAGTPAGYHIYKFSAAGVPVRVNSTLVTGTSFTSTQPYEAGAQYMVRAAKLETTASGSWWNLSLGATATAPAAAVTAYVKVLLEGPYESGTGLMKDALRTAGLVPAGEPYTALGFAQVGGGGGEVAAAGALTVTGADAIVDWVRVELRSSGSPATVVACRHGLLQRDGDVVAADGTSPLAFPVAAGSYHVAVRHRNHLGAMTAAPVALSAGGSTVDFRGTSMATYGTEAQRTSGSVRMLWAGNATGDAQLKYTGAGNDRDPLLTRVGGTTPNGTAGGYLPEDIDLSGQVRYTGAGNDRDPILVNVGATTPNGVRVQQLP